MRHIKIFEDFFKFYRADEITDTKGIWGCTREEIEDLFIRFVDDLRLSVSVNFVLIGKSGSTTYSVTDSMIPEYLERIKSGDMTPGIQVNMFVNSNIFWKAGIDGDGGVLHITDKSDMARKYSDYLNSLSDEMESLMGPIRRRVRGYEIKTRNCITEESFRRRRFSNQTDIHPDSGTEYGDLIYGVYLKKI